MGELRQFIFSVFSGILSSFIFNIILVYWGFIGNNDLTFNSFLMVLIDNWSICFIVMVVISVIIFQRLRMVETCDVNRYQSSLQFVAIELICAYNLMWQVNIQDNYLTENLPFFTYNLNGPLCSNIFKEELCLTPLKVSNRVLFYELRCPNCNKVYFKFKNLKCYKKDIELKIYPYLIKNKISTSEQFIEFIKNNRYF